VSEPAGPACLDLHCHGALGFEFGGAEAGSRKAAAYHRERGARVVASLVSAPPPALERQVRTLAPLVADGTVAGIHLEGPCLAPARRGAHDAAALIAPDPRLADRLAGAAADGGAPGAIVHWTHAPELPGADAFAEALVRLGIRPALGHTAADGATMARAITTGADATGAPVLITHLFNAMPPLHHRTGGPVAAALSAAARGDAVLELIADGVHVAPEVIRMVFDLVGPAAIALVSDATPATGLGDGRHRLGELDVDVHDGIARVSDGGAIAGSTATLPDCMTRAVAMGIDRDAVWRSASRTPATLIVTPM